MRREYNNIEHQVEEEGTEGRIGSIVEEWEKLHVVEMGLPEMERVMNEQHQRLMMWEKSWRWYVFLGFCAGCLFVFILFLIFGGV